MGQKRWNAGASRAAQLALLWLMQQLSRLIVPDHSLGSYPSRLFPWLRRLTIRSRTLGWWLTRPWHKLLEGSRYGYRIGWTIFILACIAIAVPTPHWYTSESARIEAQYLAKWGPPIDAPIRIDPYLGAIISNNGNLIREVSVLVPNGPVLKLPLLENQSNQPTVQVWRNSGTGEYVVQGDYRDLQGTRTEPEARGWPGFVYIVMVLGMLVAAVLASSIGSWLMYRYRMHASANRLKVVQAKAA